MGVVYRYHHLQDSRQRARGGKGAGTRTTDDRNGCALSYAVTAPGETERAGVSAAHGGVHRKTRFRRNARRAERGHDTQRAIILSAVAAVHDGASGRGPKS